MNNFNRNFNRASKGIGCAVILIVFIDLLLSIAFIGGIIWVIVAILKYFGIVG